MPRIIKCKGTKPQYVPHEKFEFDTTQMLPCENETFELVQRIAVASRFESPDGKAQLVMQPVYRCIDCGYEVNIQEEMKDEFNGVVL